MLDMPDYGGLNADEFKNLILLQREKVIKQKNNLQHNNVQSEADLLNQIKEELIEAVPKAE